MDKKTYIYVIIALIISSFVFFINKDNSLEPQELYRVYLGGETIGYIESEEALNEFINEKEAELKKKYNVDKVYIPKDLSINKEISYDKEISSVEQVYNKIKNKSPFTINGYTAIIKGVEEIDDDEKYITDDVIVNVLSKDVFEKALKSTVNVFISEEDYDAYINNSQNAIEDTGSLIENVYIQNEITIKQTKLPVDEVIYSDSEELSKYLLFGTLEAQKTYKVKAGDTIEQVSFDNKLSVEEFLIANEEFNSADNLLYPGEVVTLGVLKPAFKLIEEDHIVELETDKYKTEIEYDKNMYVGTEKVKQQGVNGTNKVTKKIKKSNGEIISAIIVESDQIQAPKSKIIVRGTAKRSKLSKSDSYISGLLGTWAWPTKTPYVLSSRFGYRWGKLHAGIDISGTGHGSPIYAANDGVVSQAGYTSYNGNYIIINHNNGYYTNYGHLSAILVKKGDTVTIGQQIGKMGSSGYASGTHLHFGLWKGYPYMGGVSLDPMKLYK